MSYGWPPIGRCTATSVKLTDGYAWWWLYIGHFIHVPFYCYAYAFGELLVLALVQKHRQEGAAFVPKYLDLLSAGGSDVAAGVAGRLGVDMTDPGFWELGLRLLGDMVSEAERLACAWLATLRRSVRRATLLRSVAITSASKIVTSSRHAPARELVSLAARWACM